MTSNAAEKATPSKKRSPDSAVCTSPTCHHPKPFHVDTKACRAYGCNCKRFRVKA